MNIPGKIPIIHAAATFVNSPFPKPAARITIKTRQSNRHRTAAPSDVFLRTGVPGGVCLRIGIYDDVCLRTPVPDDVCLRTAPPSLFSSAPSSALEHAGYSNELPAHPGPMTNSQT